MWGAFGGAAPQGGAAHGPRPGRPGLRGLAPGADWPTSLSSAPWYLSGPCECAECPAWCTANSRPPSPGVGLQVLLFSRAASPFGQLSRGTRQLNDGFFFP